MFINLENAPCLIVGGGVVAYRKAEKLLPYGAKITVVAPKIDVRFCEIDGITICKRAFEMSDLDGRRLVIAATDDEALNHEISAACKARAIPINVVDDKAACTFVFPALVKSGALSIGISTGGASPSAAVYVKNQIAASLPKSFDEILAYLDACRDDIKLRFANEAARSSIFAKLFDACMAKKRPLTAAEYGDILAQKTGKVYLVGAGCGAADLITVRGKNLLQSCDCVVYDALIDTALLDFAPTAEKISVGKRSGKHSATQDEINEILIKMAQKHSCTVRLKGGDPFVFGRGGEEIQALQNAGIAFEEVPGISSAIAIPAAAGIPVTHRGLAQSFHVITGHTANGLPENIETLAKLNGTLVFLMALKNLPSISTALIKSGKNPNTPAAAVSTPLTIRGTLADIAEKTAAANMQPPAVIVVGDVAGLLMKNEE